MTGVKFSGISGEVKFNGNDRIANLTVRNFVNGTYRTVATYDTITETFTHENVLVNWGNGCDATIPRDRAVEVFHGCSGLTSFALLLGSCAKAVAIVSSLGQFFQCSADLYFLKDFFFRISGRSAYHFTALFSVCCQIPK